MVYLRTKTLFYSVWFIISSTVSCEYEETYYLQLQFQNQDDRENVAKISIWALARNATCLDLTSGAITPQQLITYSFLELEFPTSSTNKLIGVPAKQLLFFAEAQNQTGRRFLRSCKTASVAGHSLKIQLKFRQVCIWMSDTDIHNNQQDDDCDGLVDECESGDTDLDGISDCQDGCPNDPTKTTSGTCGCGLADIDSDGDQIADCIDGCLDDPDKITPGVCGCGIPDVDSDNNGVTDCIETDCGDGIVDVEAGEMCDGNGVGIGGETSLCDTDCTAALCGDKMINPTAGEFCDDGNSEAGDGCDSNCYGEGLSLGTNSASLAADDTSPNGVEIQRPCQDGAVATGIYGKSGQWIDRLGFSCQPLNSSFRSVGTMHESNTVGSSTGGNPFGPLLCANEELLVAITVRYNNHFRFVQGHCRTAATIYAGEDNTNWTSNTSFIETGGTTDLISATISCPAGSVVTGIAGFDSDSIGGYTSLVYLLCHKMAR